MASEPREPEPTGHVVEMRKVVDRAHVTRAHAAECLYCRWWSPVRPTWDEAFEDGGFHTRTMEALAESARRKAAP
jgi:hypothetical protein